MNAAKEPLIDEGNRIGTVVAGRYRLTTVIGVGGMGVVYRGEDIRGRGAVAVKVLRGHLNGSDEAIGRFEREALVGAQVGHPNCVGVSEVGRCEDGAIYLVMELLVGEPLSTVLDRQRPLPWRRALHIARHILRGLAHAHGAGVVHRDIKPDNIYVCTQDGDPDFARLLDFGIAKLVGGAPVPALTQLGLTIGTPEYLSPEQAGAADLDGRSDLYSLSVVLFEVLTGRVPFTDRNPVNVLIAHATAAVPSFAEVSPEVAVPRAVEELVRAGLAKRRDERIDSAQTFIARIDELLDADDEIDRTGAVLDGRYRIDRLLGAGSTGRVYQGHHLGIGRNVAVKVLDPRLVGDDDIRRRFDREAHATGRLSHPNCVAITDSGATTDGGRYLVMELVAGTTLDAVIASQRRLPLERAVHVMRHLLRGLAHAHAQGLIHRDLKPANLMLTEEGGDRDFVKILDFGLARLIHGGDDEITRTGVVCGTPRYMAPEQAHGCGLDVRTDLYAASLIFFEMLTGRPPFESEDASRTLKMHLVAPVPSIESVAPDVVVPPAIEELIRRGLAKRAADRPSSADEYLAELGRAAAAAETVIALSPDLVRSSRAPAAAPPPVPGGTIELTRLESLLVPALSPPSPPVAPPSFEWFRHRRTVGVVAAAIFAIGVIAAVARQGGSSDEVLLRVATSAAREAEPEIDPAPTRSMDPAIESALRLAAEGRGQQAVARLRELRRKRPDDATVVYALGRAYHGLGWPKQTVAAYRDALRMDPSLRDDPELIRDLVSLLGSRTGWQAAAQLLEQGVGEPAEPALAATAAGHRDPAVRTRAKRIHDRL
jgi:eukaryotic-like serine/threonine-protein kinase